MYTFGRFSKLTLLSLFAGFLVTGLIGWGMQPFLTTRGVRGYYQIIGGNSQENTGHARIAVQVWARVNHTIVILNDTTIQSIITVRPFETPWNHNVTMGIRFGGISFNESNFLIGRYPEYPLPLVLGGNMSWSGIFGLDLQINETVIISTKLMLNQDAIYYVGSMVLQWGYDGLPKGGFGAHYFLTVEQGRITKVTDQTGLEPPPIMSQAEMLPP